MPRRKVHDLRYHQLQINMVEHVKKCFENYNQQNWLLF